MIATLLSLILLVLLFMAGVVAFAYLKLRDYVVLDMSVRREKYQEAVTSIKTQKPPLAPVKTIKRGRAIVKTDELKDLSEIPFDEGIRAIEEMIS